jgi:hypothetical protein
VRRRGGIGRAATGSLPWVWQPPIDSLRSKWRPRDARPPSLDDVNGMSPETVPQGSDPAEAPTPAPSDSEDGRPPSRRPQWRQGVAIGTVAIFGIVVVLILAASSQAPPPMPRSSGAQGGASGAPIPTAGTPAPTSPSAPTGVPAPAGASDGASALAPSSTSATTTTQPGQAPAPVTSSQPAQTAVPAAAPNAATCPSGAPQAAVTYTATPELHVSNTWKVTMTGTATNTLTTPVAIVSATVELADSNGVDQGPDKLVPDAATGSATLDPGQSVAISDAAFGGTQITSTGQPTVGKLTVQWTWPAGSQYLACPSGST